MPPDAAVPAWELWGTFPPANHLRKRAFVADVLIYDKLVVPVPAGGDKELKRKWERRWNWRRQDKLLKVIDKALPGLVHRVDWTDEHDAQWRVHARRTGHVLELTSGMSRDVGIIQAVDREEDLDSLNYLAEREYLRDVVNPKRDREIRNAVPLRNLMVVAAYGSYRQFRRDPDQGRCSR
jgi:hypothetical protein